MSEERILIPCPNCGDNLFWQNTQILCSQVKLDFSVAGELEIDCEKCGAEVGPFLTSVINAYSRLVKELFGETNALRDLRNLIGAIQEAIDSLPLPLKGGKLSKPEVLNGHLGLRNGQGKTLQKIADEALVSRAYVHQTYIQTLRQLRHPSRSRLIVRALWMPLESVGEIIRRAEEAEIAKQELRDEIESLDKFLRRRGLLDKAYPHVPHVQIEELGLLRPICYTLQRVGIRTAADALRADPEELLEIGNFGPKSFQRLAEALLAKGIDVEKYWDKDFRKWYK